MPKEWTDDEVANEIREAIAIVREDRFERFVRERAGQGDPGKSAPPPSTGNNPDPNANTPKKSKSLFWGESVD